MTVPWTHDALPLSTADRRLMMALVRAWLRTLPKKQRRDAVRYVSKTLELEAEGPIVVPLRPMEGDDVATAREAEALWRSARELLIPLLVDE